MRNEGGCRGPVPGLGADMAALVPLLTGAKASRNLPVCFFNICLNEQAGGLQIHTRTTGNDATRQPIEARHHFP